MGNWETFKLSELRLDLINYRTGKTASQRAAIGAIIDDQKKKLANLAEDILAWALSALVNPYGSRAILARLGCTLSLKAIAGLQR